MEYQPTSGKNCTACGKPIGTNVLTERIGGDYYCVPCADSIWRGDSRMNDSAKKEFFAAELSAVEPSREYE